METKTTIRGENTKTRAKELEIEVLRVIAVCGYLTTRLIALAVWLNSSEHVARNRAQLVLIRLEKKRLVLKKASQSGERIWILTKNGADELKATFKEESWSWAKDGHDLGFTRIQKDKLALERAIQKMRESTRVCGFLGRAALRAGMSKHYQDCDAVFIDFDEHDEMAQTGLVTVVDARASLVERVVKMKSEGLTLEFVGDAHLIGVLLKRVAQAN